MPYRDPRNFNDREISWLAFNRRVLEEALDEKTPLLDRLKFLGIVSTNLDEFFMIRVSGVQEQIASGVRRKSVAGLTPSQEFDRIHEEAHLQVDELYACFGDTIVPELAANQIEITHPSKLSRKARKDLRTRFEGVIFPVLTPLAVDSGHPFPRLRNLSLNLIVHLAGAKKIRTAGDPVIGIVQVPSMLPRLIEVPATRDKLRYVLLEDVIMQHVNMLFPGMKVKEALPFQITRDADIEYQEIEAEDLLKYIEAEIRERERGSTVRLAIANEASEQVIEFLSHMLNLSENQIYRVRGPINISDVSSSICRLEGREHLKEEPFTPNIPRPFRGTGSIFSKIRRADLLLHHPYESFVPVVDFIREAASDPKVLAIKQTLYRTSGDSPIIQSLIDAAENGKQVTALVELKARFDEENNIVWARRLEEAGVHVVYGLVGLKVHCKVALVVRREGDSIRQYVHMSTGNYNPTTARLYSDIGLFSCDPGFCSDATVLFNMLTGYAQAPRWQRLIVAPDDLRDKTIELIEAEREKAERGEPARIRAKFNSLVDGEIIVELFRASRAGVQIDLCIRGICCLMPGLKGVSENIRVWSIVDRFLEHSRVFIFGEDPNPKVFLSSADWMDRNMDRRIEVMFPVLDPVLVQRCVEEIYGYCARDNVKSRHLQSDGRYKRAAIKPGEEPFRSQYRFIDLEDTRRAAESRTAGIPKKQAERPIAMQKTDKAPEKEEARKTGQPVSTARARSRKAPATRKGSEEPALTGAFTGPGAESEKTEADK